MLEPLIGFTPEAMHRAVKVHCWNCFVRIENTLQDLEISIPGGTFVVNDDVVTLCPVGIIIERERGIHRLVVGPPDIHLHVSSLLNAFEKSFMLAFVIMAASTRDE
jgi:hypothetical protein